MVVEHLAVLHPAQRDVARLLLGIPAQQSAAVQGDVAAHVLPKPPHVSVGLKLRRSGAAGLCVPERGERLRSMLKLAAVQQVTRWSPGLYETVHYGPLNPLAATEDVSGAAVAAAA